MSNKKLPKGRHFKTSKVIGRGSFATVYKGKISRSIRTKINETTSTCAIKEIKLHEITIEKDKIFQEIEMMEKLHHENIIKLFYVEPENYKEANIVYVMMEFCDKGDLGKYLSIKGRLNIDEVKEIFIQLLLSLKYLSENKIVHRDLKPQNILLKSDPNSKYGYKIKLADFGFARKIPKSSNMVQSGVMNTICGTPLYMAPEVLNQKEYTAIADLWSVGAIFYELLTGSHAFLAHSLQDLKQQYSKITYKKFPNEFQVPQEYKQIVEKLLVVNPDERMTREELFNHPFLFQKPKILENFNKVESDPQIISQFIQNLQELSIEKLPEQLHEMNERASSLTFIADKVSETNSADALSLYMGATNLIKDVLIRAELLLPNVKKDQRQIVIEKMNDLKSAFLRNFQNAEIRIPIVRIRALLEKDDQKRKFSSIHQIIFENALRILNEAEKDSQFSNKTRAEIKFYHAKKLLEVLCLDPEIQTRKKDLELIFGLISQIMQTISQWKPEIK
ncbi:serine/threonine-protein kinase ulk3 [Anaeramoeba ignava]|uniref:Serine/threonine-protein kinase ulk3 n=1 Tax=Anaeramoeba ignava TaxID=1746090 RepID=A0A9Q0L4X4_ANAIG|nr:serine/threonine-protein kinase ulk3 [Anaeramoeba ignava]